MLFSGPLFLFLISAMLTPVFNYMLAGSKPPVYKEDIPSITLNTRNPFFTARSLEDPRFHLTGVIPADEGRKEKKPALKVSLLDGRFRELRPNVVD